MTPESGATSFLPVDSNVPHYAELCAYAGRAEALLREQALQNDEGVISSLDFFVGALHALHSAGRLGFRERKGRSPQTAPIQALAAGLSRGLVRNDGPWLAGFHFNNALARLAALFERALKIAAGRRGRGEKQKEVLAHALARYQQWCGSAWTYTHINAVYNEVNDLKHDPAGLYPGRRVEFDQAILAADELLVLLEAWNRAGRP